MVHQIDIAAIIAADQIKPVGEFLTRGEQLFEVGETTAHRLAARIYDLRLGQDQLDQTNMPEIIGHFVNEEGRSVTMDTRGLQEGLTQGLKLAAGQDVEIGGIGALPSTAQAKAAGEGGYVGQLHRAFNLAVRGQYLFQKGGTGSGQSDDEDWIGRIRT